MAAPTVVMSAILEDYSQAVSKLFETLPQAAEHDRAAGELIPLNAMEALLEVDARLRKAVDYVEFHQAFQQEIETVQASVRSYDKQILSLAKTLHNASRQLDELVERGQQRLQILKQVEDNPVDVGDIIQYAHRIAGTTSAPPLWNPAMPTDLFNHRPPRPNEEDIRAGLLYANNRERKDWLVGSDIQAEDADLAEQKTLGTSSAITTETRATDGRGHFISSSLTAASAAGSAPTGEGQRRTAESVRKLLNLDLN